MNKELNIAASSSGGFSVYDKAGEILQPPLDVFSGADGGVAYAKLRHVMLPKWITDSANGDYDAQQLLKIVEQYSRLCKLVMSE